MAATDARPFFLNLLKIRLPVQGVVSIIHRITGVLMFVGIPLLAWLLEMSLQGEAGFNRALEILSLPLSRIVVGVLVWSLVHHLLAGIRYLLIDFDIGLGKQQSRNTAWLVLVMETVLLLILLAGICL